ncbi:MAG TPA: hypothetical protein VFC85_08475, partial [Verrucomicrobiae bacterium]|nr:hypothetical protein [Verrucomicrobiae bacterium]
MTREEAKNVLLLYRPDAPGDDPQIAAALALAKTDAELARWLEKHRARDFILRAKFRQIAAPAGLKEQIISEHFAEQRRFFSPPPKIIFATATALALVILTLIFWPHASDDSLSIFRGRMASAALRGYAMDLSTSDPSRIRNFLKQNSAPGDFVLPPALQKISATGCAIETWQSAKVSMICFRTGDSKSPATDLWLFVVNRA